MSHVLSLRAPRRASFLVAVAGLALVVGCRRAKPTVAAPAPASVDPAPRPTEPVIESAPRAASSIERPSTDDAVRRARSTLEQIVYFPFDSFELDASARALLDAKAEVLRSDPTYAVQIEGHADDRGSEEYNMALAMRRALTVQRYLVALGISPQRFETVSFGEERPSCSAPNEACWSTNRRAEFVVRGGE